MPNPHNATPTLVAWENALRTFKKDMSSKDLKSIQAPTKLEDLIENLRKWNAGQSGRSNTGINVINNGLLRIQRFNACIDVLSQGLPDPAVLLWGSIRFAMKIVQDYGEEYDKICEAFAAMINSLPRVEIYADTFPTSSLVQDSIHDIFVSSLQFWQKACKFYRRRKLFNLLRATWSNYDLEFSRLETAMKDALDRVEKGGLAMHIKESKSFQAKQESMNEKLYRPPREEMTAKLARLIGLSESDLAYHLTDQTSTLKLRHSGTCEWIFSHEMFLKWSEMSASTDVPSPQLWIYGGPGTGKTVLTSAIIDRLRDQYAVNDRDVLIYFYFKANSPDNNNFLSATKSFLYQLLAQTKGNSDVEAAFSKAFDDTRPFFQITSRSLWYTFCSILGKLLSVTFVLDGLDECEESRSLVSALNDRQTQNKIKILVVSRREKRLMKDLRLFDTLEITPEHVEKDIRKFIEYKIARNPRLSNPLVSELVENKLVFSSNGMFLWVRLVLKELKACLSLEQMHQTLTQVPTGLEAMYLAVLRRLELTLMPPAVDMARRVFAWAATCVRPISFQDLCTALSYQYQSEGHTILFESSQFPYSEKDVEIMCGSLVVFRDGQLLAAHCSIRSYLRNFTGNIGTGSSLLPSSSQISLDLATVCVGYIAEHSPCVLTQSTAGVHSGSGDKAKNGGGFMDYACLYWLFHALDCPITYRNELARLLASRFTQTETTRSWLQRSFLLDKRGLWRLVIGTEELLASLVERRELSGAVAEVAQLCDWCTSMLKYLKDYGGAFKEHPYLLQTLELGKITTQGGSKSNQSAQLPQRHEVEITLPGLSKMAAEDPDFQRTHLGYGVGSHFNLWKSKLGFLVYDNNQGLLLSGEADTGPVGSQDSEWLYAQDAETGKRLPPVVKGLNETFFTVLRGGSVVTTRISKDGRYFVIAYDHFFSVWVIERNVMGLRGSGVSRRLEADNWATRLILSPYYHARSLKLMKLRRLQRGASVIALNAENHLFVPGGFFKLPSREFHPFDPFEEIDSSDSLTMVSPDGSQVSRMQVEASQLKLIRYSTRSPKHPLPTATVEERISSTSSTYKPSHSGSWFVLFEPIPDGNPSTILLVESSSSRTFEICPGKAHFGNESFHFSEDDRELVTFLHVPSSSRTVFATVIVTVWALGQDGPKALNEGSVKMAVKSCSSWGLNIPHITFKSNSLAWIVSCDRSIYAVQLKPSVSFPGHELVQGYARTRGSNSSIETPMPRDIPDPDRMTVQISQDGTRLATLHVRESEVKVIITSISQDSAGQILSDRVYQTPSTDFSLLDVPVILTHSFDTLVAGNRVFIMDQDGSGSIKLDMKFTKYENNGYYGYYCDDSNWRGTISDCGDFVAFWTSTRLKCTEMALFRLDKSSLTARRLDTFPFNTKSCIDLDLKVLSVDFHTHLPIAVITYGLGEAYRERYNGPNLGEVLTATIQLTKPPAATGPFLRQFGNSSNNSKQSEPSSTAQLHRKDVVESIYPECPDEHVGLGRSELFSTCGTFTYLECKEDRLILSRLQASHKPLRVLKGGTIAHVSEFRSYELLSREGRIGVKMNFYQNAHDGAKPPFYQKLMKSTTVECISAYPEKWWIWAWLVLGVDHDEQMRLVIVPPPEESSPILKTLTISWNEVVKALEKESPEGKGTANVWFS
ncbi:Vegetative incompatibility protein [Paramyrothecium foliicola]|nr:Vegetative incompatibility protein [Paramyrothecium foliicola]